MNQNFSEELQQMYRNILLQQHNIAYASMIAAFSAAAENADLLNKPVPSSSMYLLDSDIPREDIECDVEIVLVKQLRDNLKKLETNLNGMHGKKFGFREVIEMVNTRQPYPVSPGGSELLKRARSSMLSLPSTPNTSKDEGNVSKKSRTAEDTATSLDISNASSCEGNLTIDLPVTPSTPADKNKSSGAEKSRDNLDDPSCDPTSSTYKPSKLRFERLRNITKKKPKFNIDNLDLTYHSNMARNFPGSENRTGEQQARRDRNTLAARISRTKNKAYERMLEKQSVEATSVNINLKRQIACLRVYANELMKANGFPDSNLNQMWESNIRDILCNDD
jgi:hypothetical protein